jgi:uncharacterized protein YbjT (DUF2867 family)
MKIVVIGGTGLIGSKLVNKLRIEGHEALAASPNTGVDTLTGRGLSEALKGASVVVDVSNSPSFEAKAVLQFFETSTHNLLVAEAEAGVGHHVALSVVGTERLLESGYFPAKLAQEKRIVGAHIPYSIVRATQFFEFAKSIAASATDGNNVRVSSALIQPIAAEDVASALLRVTLGPARNDTLEIGGPEALPLSELMRQLLAAQHDPREVLVDPNATYFGARLSERTLVPDEGAALGTIRFRDWLQSSVA